jgi:DNA-directed RNA polymerase subunit K/omega
LDTYSINPVVVRMKESDKGIVYQSIVALGMRSRQINDQIKNEIQTRLADVITDNDTETTNYDQIAISREFDNMLKPTFLAMREILDDKLHFEMPKLPVAETEE